MKKGHYLFSECGAFCKKLQILGVLCFVTGIAFIIVKGALELDGSNQSSVLTIYFGLFLLFANLCINKVCEDVARLLKELEEKKFQTSSDQI